VWWCNPEFDKNMELAVGEPDVAKRGVLMRKASAAIRDDVGMLYLENVPSFRHAKDIVIDVVGHGTIAGDIAWGGNWFFLVEDHGQALKLDNVDHLTNYTWRIRQALERNGVSGANGQLIDHIILYGPPDDPKNNSRDFVLCPSAKSLRFPGIMG